MSFLNILSKILFPEHMLEGTPWAKEWREEIRERILRSTRWGGIIVGFLWVLHYPFFDVLLHKGSLRFWLAIRIGLFAFSLITVGLTYWPKLARSVYFRAPMILNSFAFCVIESQAMNWSSSVHFVYPVVMVILCALILQANLFWSVMYALALFAAEMPAFIRHGENLRDVVSAMSMSFAFICLYRSRFQDEVGTFLNGRLFAEAKQRVLVQELELTGAVQKLLLPAKGRIGADCFEMAARFIPAAYSAGDWWWYEQSGEKLWVIIGDVTGHGAGPAMVTATIAGQVKTLYDPEQPFVDLLRKVRANYMKLFGESDYWMTVTAAEIDFKSMQISAWFAGGPPLFLFADGTQLNMIGTPSRPLGAGSGDDFGFVQSSIKPGDRIAFLSDGIYEERIRATNQVVGFRKIDQWFKTFGKSLDVETAAERFLRSINNQRGPRSQTDDYTLVIVDVKKTSIERAAG